jgi:hypothetical protein
MPRGAAFVTFLGGLGASPVEQLVAEARRQAMLDTAERALSTGRFDHAIVATDHPSPDYGAAGLDADFDRAPFHFGRRLAGLIRDRGLHTVVYLGGGSLPLLPAEAFVRAAEAAAAGRVLTNNLYSGDLVAFPATSEVVAAVERAERDNALPRLLGEAGMAVEALDRSIETLFDIDSPADLAVLALGLDAGAPYAPPRRLASYLANLALDLGRFRRLLPVFVNQERQLLVAGRVGSHAWAYLERETACRVRLFAEERGMEAEARAEAGRARSLLGFYLDSVGVPRFFETLAELGDAAVIDTRVLLAHRRLAATRADRFLSDMGRHEAIGEPFLRELTGAAAGAPIPVLLGGHSLVSGGLMLLNEHAWALRDAGRL